MKVTWKLSKHFNSIYSPLFHCTYVNFKVSVFRTFASEELCQNPPLPGPPSCFTCLDPRLNWPQHKTNGALVHSCSNNSMIQLILYGMITTLANCRCTCSAAHRLLGRLLMLLRVYHVFMLHPHSHLKRSMWMHHEISLLSYILVLLLSRLLSMSR